MAISQGKVLTVLWFVILSLNSCSADDDDDADVVLATGIIYALAFGVAAIVSVLATLSCMFCSCCPYYRGKSLGARRPMNLGPPPPPLGMNVPVTAVGTSNGGFAYVTNSTGAPTIPAPYPQQLPSNVAPSNNPVSPYPKQPTMLVNPYSHYSGWIAPQEPPPPYEPPQQPRL